MTFLKRLALAFHVVTGLFLVVLAAAFLFRIISISAVLEFLYAAYVYDPMRILMFIFLGVSLFFNYILFRFLAKASREKQVIVFDNPAGKIRVSIYALEELSKRVASGIKEVKDVQTRVELKPKSLDVDLKLVLTTDANILELTSRIQNLVRRRIQETISLEHPVNVSAYVSKIDPVKIDANSIKGATSNPYTDIQVPFQGYRA